MCFPLPMTTPLSHKPIGATGASLPPIVFGSSCLGNLYAVVPEDKKAAIVRNWVAEVSAPAAIDSAGKYGAGMALQNIGRWLREYGVAPSQVAISNKLAWYRIPLKGAEPTFEKGVWEGLTHDAEQRISPSGILECWEQGCELLGDYRPSLLSVHDPDEYLAAATDAGDRARRKEDILGAYAKLFELKKQGHAKAVGIGSKDWRVIRELAADIPFDWVMLACSFTIMQHPSDLLQFIGDLHRRQVFMVNSAVFHSGFLTGGRFFDYRPLDPISEKDKPLFAWRSRFEALCRKHEVTPAHACVQFGMSAPGIHSVSLNTGNPDRVAENVRMTVEKIPATFWAEAKGSNLIDPGYPHL